MKLNEDIIGNPALFRLFKSIDTFLQYVDDVSVQHFLLYQLLC